MRGVLDGLVVERETSFLGRAEEVPLIVGMRGKGFCKGFVQVREAGVETGGLKGVAFRRG